MRALDNTELATLIQRLERGVAETSAGFRSGGYLVMALFVGCAIIFVVKGAYGVAAITGGFGAGVLWLAVHASRKTSPERAASVIRALREQPQRIATIRHYVTSSSTGMFQRDWLEVKTDDGRLVVKAVDDWEPLMVLLVRHCPQAKVTRAR